MDMGGKNMSEEKPEQKTNAIIEEIKKIRDVVSQLNIEKIDQHIENLDELVGMWKMIQRCIVGNCEIIVDEYAKKATIRRVPVGTSVEIDGNITIRDLTEQMRRKIAENYDKYLKYTTEQLVAVVNAISSELNTYRSTIDDIMQRLDEIEENLKEDIGDEEE